MRLAERAIEGALRGVERLIERRTPRVNRPLDAARFDWVSRVEAAFPRIRAELDAALATGIRTPATDQVVGAELGTEGEWSTLMLCSFGTWLPFNTARFPETTELLRTIPGVTIAGFSVLHAGAHIPRHRGPSKAVRYHLGIIVPEPPGATRLAIGDEVHEWAEGRSVFFDDATEHEAWNDADTDRYVLFIETLWPASGLVGLANRGAQRLLALGAREVPARAAELDAALNP